MPRDVSTRWNLTGDMVDFGIDYYAVIEAITDKWKLGLGRYAIDDEEWGLLRQLRDVLKVMSRHCCDGGVCS